LENHQKSNFIIGIGGGSPIDAAKAAGVLINNPNATRYNLFDSPHFKSIPVIAIPTTAGTGTETTPYSIVTDNELQTKHGICQRIFPEIALLDVKYLMFLPEKITINTTIDALSHLIEGYLSSKANIVSDALAEKGLKLFGECLNMIKEKDFTFIVREKINVGFYNSRYGNSTIWHLASSWDGLFSYIFSQYTTWKSKRSIFKVIFRVL